MSALCAGILGLDTIYLEILKVQELVVREEPAERACCLTGNTLKSAQAKQHDDVATVQFDLVDEFGLQPSLDRRREYIRPFPVLVKCLKVWTAIVG